MAKSLTTRQKYTPRETAKVSHFELSRVFYNSSQVLATFESNLVIVKMAVYPMLIMEEIYRFVGVCRAIFELAVIDSWNPALLKSAKVTNSEILYRDHPEFKAFADNLSVVKDGVAQIMGRFKLAWFGKNAFDQCFARFPVGSYPKMSTSSFLIKFDSSFQSGILIYVI